MDCVSFFNHMQRVIYGTAYIPVEYEAISHSHSVVQETGACGKLKGLLITCLNCHTSFNLEPEADECPFCYKKISLDKELKVR